MTRQVSFYLDRARAAARAGGRQRTTESSRSSKRWCALSTRSTRTRLEFAIGDPTPALSRRISGSHRPYRQPARQCRQMGAPRRRVRPSATPPAPPAASSFRRIDDDGPGLDPARAAALVRGLRLDESRPGSGLGLSIVVDLAAIYGGSLRLDRVAARRFALEPQAAQTLTRRRRGRAAKARGEPLREFADFLKLKTCFKNRLARRPTQRWGRAKPSGRSRTSLRFRPAPPKRPH